MINIKHLTPYATIDSAIINGTHYVQGYCSKCDDSFFFASNDPEQILILVNCHGNVLNKNNIKIGKFVLVGNNWVFEYTQYLKSPDVPSSIVTDFTIDQPDGLLWAEMFVFKIFAANGLL